MYGSNERATNEVDIILEKLDMNNSGNVDYSGKLRFTNANFKYRIFIGNYKHS